LCPRKPPRKPPFDGLALRAQEGCGRRWQVVVMAEGWEMRDFAVVLAGVALMAALGCNTGTIGGPSGEEAPPAATPGTATAEGAVPLKASEPAKPETPPSATEAERIKKVIKQLGAEEFEEREKATAALMALGRKALPFLEEAAKSADLETANRAIELAWKLLWPFDAAEAGRRQKLAAEALGVPAEKLVDLGGGVKLELVLIPAGAFEMGSPAGKKARQEPDDQVHRVRITKPFYLGKYEVTQEQWEKVIGKNPSDFRGPMNPVEQLSWDDCQDFLKKLNALVFAPVPVGKGAGAKAEFRLPTEAEWEYACRAGSKGRFCFGDSDDELGKYAWYQGNSGDKTHPVGEKKPNAWGMHDMHGNVWEWCQDWYGVYAGGAAQDDPIGPDKGSTRVLRGGSWNGDPDLCRSAIRARGAPADRFGVGLRLVLVVPVPESQ